MAGALGQYQVAREEPIGGVLPLSSYGYEGNFAAPCMLGAPLVRIPSDLGVGRESYKVERV